MADALSFQIGATFSANGFTAASAALSSLSTESTRAGATGADAGKKTEDAYSRATLKIQEAVQKLRDGQEAGKAAGAAGESGGDFLGSVAAGLGLGAGIEAAHLLVDAVKEIGAAFTETASRGIEFNKEIETETIGLAATLRSVDPKKYLNFEEAKVAGAAALDVLRGKANDLGLDFQSLAQAYSANLRALVEGGVTDTGKQVELVSTLLSAAASKGVTGVQALRDSIDILNGRAGNIVLAKELGLENEALKEAAKNGTLYELIIGKIGGYKDAVGATAGSLAGLEQSASNLFTQLAGALTADSFDALKAGFASLLDGLKDPSNQAAVAALGAAIGQISRSTADYVRVAADVAGATAKVFALPFSPAAELDAATAEADKLGASYSLGNRQLRDQISNATDLRSRVAAQKSVTDAIIAAEQQAKTVRSENLPIVQQQLASLDVMLSKLDQTAGRQRQIVQNENERKRAIEDQFKAEQDLFDKQVESLGITQKQISADEQRIAKLNETLNARRPLSEQEKIASDEADKQFEKLKSIAAQYGLQIGAAQSVNKIQDDAAGISEANRGKVLEQLDAYAKVLDRVQKIRAEIGNQASPLDALLTKLKAVRDALPLDGSPATADARGGLNRAIQQGGQFDNANALNPLAGQAILAQLISALAQAAAKPVTPAPAGGAPGAPAIDTPDTGPLSDANFEDTAQSARDLKDALAKGLEPIQTALNTAGSAVPGQVAPVVAAVNTFGEAYGDALSGVADAASQNAAGLGELVSFVQGLKSDLAQARRDIANLYAEA